MKPNASTFLAALVLLTLGTTLATAQISIDLVTVGDAGNPNDSTGYGGVSYEYKIATKEVNISQYTAFLNAVAKTDLYGLYNAAMGSDLNIAGIARTGSSGSYEYTAIAGSGNRPVTYVSWFDAARFANWVANGQPTGAQIAATTEDGAYTLNGAVSGTSFTKNGINPNTGATTTYWIPSEDEWYKAAYYHPGGSDDDYWLYPTRSDSVPGNEIGSGTNQANYRAEDYSTTPGNNTYSSSQNYLTDGGAFSMSASHYGTYDQGGNVWEWNDAVIEGFSRGLLGGSWGNNGYWLSSSGRNSNTPSLDNGNDVGFRVASVPEPSTVLLMMMGGAASLFKRRRNSTR